MPKGGINGIRAEIYAFVKAYESSKEVSYKTANSDSIYPDSPLNESIWIFEAATNTMQSQGVVDDKDFKKEEYEIILTNTIINNEIYYSGAELFQKFGSLENLINTDKLDGSHLKFSDVYLKNIDLTTATFGVIAHYVKGSRDGVGNEISGPPPPLVTCIWDSPSNIDWLERVPPPRFPEANLYSSSDNWKWGNLLGKCDGTNVGQDAATVLEGDLNYFWSHIVTGVPLINVQTLDGTALEWYPQGSSGGVSVGEFKGRNSNTGPSNGTQQLFSQGNYSTYLNNGFFWFAHEIPNVSLAFINANDILPNDNDRDYNIYDSKYINGLVNTECLDMDDLHNYYCSMRHAIEVVRPKGWNYQGPLEFLSLDVSSDDWTETAGQTTYETKWHYLENISYGIPLSQEYEDKHYFTAY